jgi:Kef-type K+ transport system membrane component KefB
MSIFASYFPITDPTLVFFVVLLIILLAPIIMGKLRIPHLIGMVLAGVLVGKYGLNILVHDSSFELFGRVGLYYIMFLASLEMDMEGLKRNKWRTLTFGILTFAIPFLLTWLMGLDILGYTPLAALLLGCVMSSNTPRGLPHRLAIRLATTEERDAVGGLNDGQPLPGPCHARSCRSFLPRQE